MIFLKKIVFVADYSQNVIEHELAVELSSNILKIILP